MNKTLIPLALAGALLGGCAGVQTVASDVSSFGDWPADRKAGTYAFERVPSQQAQAPETDKLEAAARPALAKAGFEPASEGSPPDVLVQVGSSTVRLDRWDDPFGWYGGYGGFGYGGYTYGYGYGRGARWGSPFWGWGASPYYDRPRYDRQVAVLVRDRSSGKPLFESHAATQDTVESDPQTLAAMFEAALIDFPHRGINPRRVVVPLAQ